MKSFLVLAAFNLLSDETTPNITILSPQRLHFWMGVSVKIHSASYRYTCDILYLPSELPLEAAPSVIVANGGSFQLLCESIWCK
jgi:hypothetical protein